MGFDFSIDDDALLLVSGVGNLVYSGHALLAPKHFHDFYVPKDQPYSAQGWRWFGHANAFSAAQILTVRASTDKKTKKDALKTLGAGWLLCAGHMALETQEGKLKKEICLPNVVGMVGMGALCLWKGFQDN